MNLRNAVLFVAVLAFAAPARGDVLFADGRVAVDGHVRTTAHWWQTEYLGLGKSEFSFEPVLGEFGVTGHLNDVVSLRASAWAFSQWGVGLNDLYVHAEWPSGWSVTAGQFIPPLSLDALIPLGEYPLAFEMAMHTGGIKAAGLRDVGVMGAYRKGMWNAAAAVVNGNGTGSWSSSKVDQKDVCGRLLVQPWCSWPWLGGRIYRTVWLDGTGWLTLGGEAVWEAGSLRLAAEFQNHISDGGRNHYNSGYAQALYRFRELQPGLRLELKQPYGKRPEFKASVGSEWRPFGERLKLAGHYSYQHNTEERWLRGAVLLRLQAGL